MRRVQGLEQHLDLDDPYIKFRQRDGTSHLGGPLLAAAATILVQMPQRLHRTLHALPAKLTFALPGLPGRFQPL